LTSACVANHEEGDRIIIMISRLTMWRPTVTTNKIRAPFQQVSPYQAVPEHLSLSCRQPGTGGGCPGSQSGHACRSPQPRGCRGGRKVWGTLLTVDPVPPGVLLHTYIHTTYVGSQPIGTEIGKSPAPIYLGGMRKYTNYITQTHAFTHTHTHTHTYIHTWRGRRSGHLPPSNRQRDKEASLAALGEREEGGGAQHIAA
jgi:hypothetical protein